MYYIGTFRECLELQFWAWHIYRLHTSENIWKIIVTGFQLLTFLENWWDIYCFPYIRVLKHFLYMYMMQMKGAISSYIYRYSRILAWSMSCPDVLFTFSSCMSFRIPSVVTLISGMVGEGSPSGCSKLDLSSSVNCDRYCLLRIFDLSAGLLWNFP